VPPPSCQESPPKPSLLLALLCAGIVAAYDRTWLARPVSALIPDGGPRPDRLSRLKAGLLPAFAALLDQATRRGRPRVPAPSPEARSGRLAGALLAVATRLLAEGGLPLRRRRAQEQLVCAYDRLREAHGATEREFCAALALSERTFRSWRTRPPAPPPPASPPRPPSPPRNDRATGRFSLDTTAPETQLGGDTTDLRLLGVDLKLVAAQDLGAREQRLWEAFALDERETADLVAEVLADAAAGREGLQFVTDQGKPFMAQAARDAYDALGVEHAPQREGAPTEKATVERAFLTVKDALAPLLVLTNRLADAIPSLRQPQLARHLGTLLLAVFLRVYAAGRRHLVHPLTGHDPDALRATIEEQRDRARAEHRSVRLFLEAIHDEYAMPGSRESFVRTFRRYPLEDLRVAERRFRLYACRCVAHLCDRYFAAVVRDVHEQGRARRAAEWHAARAAADARRVAQAAEVRAAELEQHPERRLTEGLDVLEETWLPDQRRFLADGRVAAVWLRRAVVVIHLCDPLGARDVVEAHWRSWLAGRPQIPRMLCDAIRAVLTKVMAHILGPNESPHSPAALVGAMLPLAARRSIDNPRPTPPPHLRN
jgi:hypothetical protein